MNNDELLNFPLYTSPYTVKQNFLITQLLNLFEHHCQNNLKFKCMMEAVGYSKNNINKIEDFPYIPVRLFKLHDLCSVPKNEIVKIMTSSGTTGQAVSKIYLDKTTASLQTKVLTKIISSFIGNSRVPMIIIDSESTIKNRNQFSARAAGITGFSMFASKRIFALNEDMSLNIEGLKEFIRSNKGKSIFFFGFTYIIYQHFYKKLLQQEERLDIENGILIHGGGWKKLINESVDSKTFRRNLNEVSGLDRVYDYYGMVEQTGSIHMECEKGYLHPSIYSDVIVRKHSDFSECSYGEEGIIQLISLLPTSYPGHSILTEDVGVLYGEDDCECGRKGKYFKINGRLKNAEIRGCSDTYGELFRKS